MPIRQGKAKLWFNTKQEQDEYDDKMIAAIRLQSTNYEDENFSPVFNRKRQEFFLELTDEAKSQLSRVFYALNQFKINNLSDYIDKYHTGKRDHSYWREWTVQKIGVGYVVSYLLLRELPIRNFYARTWIMLFFIGKVLEANPGFGKGIYLAPDEWTDKHIQNYGVYKTMRYQTPPTLDGKLPEEALWKLNQPGFLRPTPQFIDTAMQAVLPPKEKVVQWDGTFNMPLEGLASPKHKDAKWIDFLYE